MRFDPATGALVPETQGAVEGEKRFDLSFKGGTPKDLVAAIESATKEPLNAIIPEEHRDFILPPLKLKNVTASQLFYSLGVASSKAEYRRNPGNVFQHVNTSYGFRTPDQRPSPNSIWYFYVEGRLPSPEPQPPPPPPQVRFWNLAPYLEKLKVEDITTAVETGWKMLGVNPLPKLTFHRDTKLLVAVGADGQLRTVDDVLRELRPQVDPATGLPATKRTADKPGENAGEKPSKP
jgi:hypothetical protein